MLGHLRNNLKNQSAEPAYALIDTINSYMNNFRLLGKPMKEEDVDKMSLSKMQEVYKQRFANPGAFTFIFIGNIDLTQLAN